jgi:hypothetical protein
MAFQQLYYTSCERGLSGYPGYQFNAVTPGVGPEVMREVERLTAYEPPRSLADQTAGTEMAAYPVSLSFTPGDGTTIIANVVFVGADFSRRFGNYFAHALATSTPEPDLGPLAPIELWQAPFWERRVSDSLELPALPGPPPPGTIHRDSTQAFVDSHPSTGQLPTLLSAAAQAVSAGTRSVVVVEADAAGSAHWIAALSYLLPGPLAQQMSFTTYHHRPSYCGLHVIGTVADADVDLSEGGLDSFYLFDFTGGRFSELEVHPLAELMVRVGAVQARGLWALASRLAAGDEASLDAWYPVAAAAAAGQRHQLTAVELQTAVDWLAVRANRLDRADVESLGAALMDQHRFSRRRHAPALMSAATAAGATALKEQIDDIERRLVDQALARLARDERRDDEEPFRLSSVLAEAHARKRCDELLTAADLAGGLKLLGWAEEVGVRLGDHALKAWGECALGPRLLRDPTDAQTGRVYASHPAVLYGVAAHLEQVAVQDAGAVHALIRQGIDGLLRDEQLAGRPRVHQLVLLERGARNPELRVESLALIVQLRGAREVDEDTLAYLWPGSRWSLKEARGVLERLSREQATSGAVPAWLSATLSQTSWSGNAELGNYLSLCTAIVDAGIDRTLSEDARRRAGEAVWALQGLAEARRPDARRATKVAVNLAEGFADMSAPVQELLLQRLPGLLVRDLPLDGVADALAACPADLLRRYVDQAAMELGTHRPDPDIALRAFVVTWHLRQRLHPYWKQLDQQVLSMTLPSWRRRDIEGLSKLLQRQRPEARPAFEDWLTRQQGGGGRQERGRGGTRRAASADGDGVERNTRGVTARFNEWLRGRKH